MNKLKQKRTERGISKTKLAIESNLSIKTISRAESDKGVRDVTLHKILNALNSLTNKDYKLEDVFPSVKDVKNDKIEKSSNFFPFNALQEASIDIWIDPGEANKEDLFELYISLSELYRAHGGIGLTYIDEGIEALRFEEGLI